MWRDEIEQVAREAGFVLEYDPHLDVLVCTVSGQDYSLLILQRSGQWYVANRCSRFFHLHDASMLPDLCATFFQERPGCGIGDVEDASWSEVPEPIKVRFQLAEVEPHERVEELLHPHLEGGLLYRDYLTRMFGFRSYSEREKTLGMTLAEGKALVEQDRGSPITFRVERVAVNDDLIYLPYTYIGCVGYLVERHSRRVMLLGSGMLPHVHIWAYYRGFWDCKGSRARVARGRGENTLLIRAVHNLEKTREVLAMFVRDNVTARELAKQLHHPPCLARGVALLPYIHAFMEAEEQGYFDFEVNPEDAEPGASEMAAPPCPLAIRDLRRGRHR